MKAHLTNSYTSNNYTFVIEHDTSKYFVNISLDENGRFIHESITHPNGQELDFEGEEGDIRDTILDFLDENWEKLV